jgi:hypothetical protein
MAFSHHVSPRIRRVFSACCCLLGLVLFQAPVIGEAVLAGGMCCTGGEHCPIAAHHHSSAKPEEATMDCEHGTTGGAVKSQNCSMSCCHTSEQSTVHAQVFVLSPDITPAAFAPICETVSLLTYDEEIGSLSPLSPPPKPSAGLI